MDKLTQRDILFILIGICVGFLFAYVFAIGFISAFDGIFEHVNISIALNESKIVDAAMAYR